MFTQLGTLDQLGYNPTTSLIQSSIIREASMAFGGYLLLLLQRINVTVYLKIPISPQG